MELRYITIFAISIMGGFSTVVAGETLQLTEQTPRVGKAAYLYEIKDNEVLVNDQLITLFAISKDGISASYRNKTDAKMKPKYSIAVYNAYGLLLGEDEVGRGMSLLGSNTYMEPGEVSAEKIHLDEYPLNEILKNSSIAIPDDLMEMKWIVLFNTNTKKTSAPE